MSKEKYLLNKLDLSEFNLGVIIPLTVEEVLSLECVVLYEDFTKFNNLLLPFVTVVDIDKLFNYSYFGSDEEIRIVLVTLVESLKVLYRTEEIEVKYDKEYNIEICISDVVINKSNFEILRKEVKGMFVIDPDIGETSKAIAVSEENRHILEEYLRLEEQYKKDMEEINKDKNKNKTTLHQIVMVVASQCLWDYEKVMKMTYYRLINSYVSIFKIDEYETYIKHKASGQFDMKNYEVKHWGEVIGK